ncbi:MAG: hypothetical protein AB7I01_08785 [Gammaproteobacteria bacterium]
MEYIPTKCTRRARRWSKIWSGRAARFALSALLLVGSAVALAASELDLLLKQLLTLDIQAAPGFSARVIVPPGELYDPLVMHARGDAVWLNDDGKVRGDKGSRMMAIAPDGKVTVLVDADRMKPVSAGFDVAPPDFGAYGGQIFALSQPKVGSQNQVENYIVQRIDVAHDGAVSVFCTLPALEGGQVSGTGVDAGFGPAGSPFAGRLFAITSHNGAIYAVGADGRCAPFTIFDVERHGSPLYLAFAPNGQSMLVSVVRGGLYAARGAAVLRVHPDGRIDPQAVVEGGIMLGGLDIAPAGFGRHAGEPFIVDVGAFEIPVPQGQRLAADGKVYRVTTNGELALVASGLVNPWGLRFVGNRLWVSDINGDFIYGKRELPDGFIVEIEPR